MSSKLQPRVEVLEHGVVIDEIRALRSERQAVREELGIADDEIVFGTVANFRREKAYEVLLEAARRALESGLPLRFVAVGQGPLEQEMRARHDRLGLGSRVQLLGYREDAVRIMSACDVFTLSSRHEGLPVSLMEALSLGLPVVATAAGALPSVITNGVEGVIVPIDDPPALAAAYVELAGDRPRREAMAEAAAKKASDFDITVATARLEAIYAELARRRGDQGRSGPS
jgi:glycosyltransferase involved in cell wall biosynthesis